MTKEEALKAFRSYAIWDLMDNFTTDELQEMIDAIVSTPSLPSDLDEAAEKFARFYDNGTCDGIAQECFKSGAEWMAGHGQTFEAHIDNGCAIASGVKLPFILWDTYEDGDVLKVQIRKKQ